LSSQTASARTCLWRTSDKLNAPSASYRVSPAAASSTVYTTLRRDGTTVLAEASSVLIRDSNGQPKALMAVIRDITVGKRAKEALKIADKLARSN
jgi:hypothetical protein